MQKLVCIIIDGRTYIFPIKKGLWDTPLQDGELVICETKKGEYVVGKVSGTPFYTDNDEKRVMNTFKGRYAGIKLVSVSKCELWAEDR
jgi:hypothetical protein